MTGQSAHAPGHDTSDSQEYFQATWKLAYDPAEYDYTLPPWGAQRCVFTKFKHTHHASMTKLVAILRTYAHSETHLSYIQRRRVRWHCLKFHQPMEQLAGVEQTRSDGIHKIQGD